MYSIVEEYVNGFNGLVSAAKKKSNAYKNDNWSSASVSTAVSSAHALQQQANEGRATGAPAVIGSKTFAVGKTAATAAATAAPATAQTAATSAIVGSRSFEYVGKTPATAQTAAPATAQTVATPAPTTEKKSVWPWIVGGIALLGVGYMILKK